jgi:hypothetical protein
MRSTSRSKMELPSSQVNEEPEKWPAETMVHDNGGENMIFGNQCPKLMRHSFVQHQNRVLYDGGKSEEKCKDANNANVPQESGSRNDNLRRKFRWRCQG